MGLTYQATGGTFAGGVFLYAGQGDDVVNVLSTAVGASTFVRTWAGNDRVVVSSDLFGTGTLSGLQGPLDIDEGGGSNQLLVSELGSSSPDQIVVNGGLIASFTVPFFITYRTTGGTLGQGLIVDTGAGSDTVDVLGLTPNAPTFLNSADGDDVLNIAVSALTTPATQLTVDGGTGFNTVNLLGSFGGGSVFRIPYSQNSGVVALLDATGVRTFLTYLDVELLTYLGLPL
jgi:hypothetical protein